MNTSFESLNKSHFKNFAFILLLHSKNNTFFFVLLDGFEFLQKMQLQMIFFASLVPFF